MMKKYHLKIQIKDLNYRSFNGTLNKLKSNNSNLKKNL